jgi:hypothetical protein
VDKIEIYNLARRFVLKFDIPEVFVVEDTVDGGVRGEAYLRHLTEGANRRYPEITEVIRTFGF